MGALGRQSRHGLQTLWGRQGRAKTEEEGGGLPGHASPRTVPDGRQVQACPGAWAVTSLRLATLNGQSTALRCLSMPGWALFPDANGDR